jgi:hypothetical protein
MRRTDRRRDATPRMTGADPRADDDSPLSPSGTVVGGRPDRAAGVCGAAVVGGRRGSSTATPSATVPLRLAAPFCAFPTSKLCFVHPTPKWRS